MRLRAHPRAPWVVRAGAAPARRNVARQRDEDVARFESMTSRVRRALKLLDELELAPAEVRELREELAGREECVVNLEAAADDQERKLLLTIKGRVDAYLRGETKPLSAAEGAKLYRQMRRERRGRAPVRRTAP